MTNNTLKYRGYLGSCETDFALNMLRGKILHINGVVTYMAETPDKLKEEFEAAVNDYLEFCREEGLAPEKPFSGTFNVRIPESLHRKTAIEASSNGCSLNEVVKNALTSFFEQQDIVPFESKVAPVDYKKWISDSTSEFVFSGKSIGHPIRYVNDGEPRDAH